jgi:hypothetical protein
MPDVECVVLVTKKHVICEVSFPKWPAALGNVRRMHSIFFSPLNNTCTFGKRADDVLIKPTKPCLLLIYKME